MGRRLVYVCRVGTLDIIHEFFHVFKSHRLRMRSAFMNCDPLLKAFSRHSRGMVNIQVLIALLLSCTSSN